MKFGQRKADAPAVSEGNGNYLRNFKDGDTVVRFIDEPDDWIVFREHYTTDRKSFPCTEDRDSCPGCTSDIESVQRASRKYATNVWLAKSDLVLPFRIPMSLAKRVFSRAERNDGTITNRDYVVMKSGKGMDTEYDIEADDKYAVDLDVLRSKSMNVQDILSESYDELWGDEKPSSSMVQAAKKEEESEKDFPSKPEQSESADSDDIEIDEDALYEMDLDGLKDLADKVGVSVPTDAKKSDVIKALLSASE